MASKMPAARDANNNRITISMAEQRQYQKPLICEFCDTSVGFVNAFTRNVGEDIVAIDPYFRLSKEHKHSATCRYNVQGQVTVIAQESEGDIFAALQGNRYELRLLAVKRAVEQLREIANKKRNPDSEANTGANEKIYVEAEKRLGAYVNSALRVLKVRAACIEHAEIEDVLQLVFDGVRLPWCDFYFEDDEYFRCFSQVNQATIRVPIAINGTVKNISIVRRQTGNLSVMDLVRPYRKTDQAAVLDAACFSIWSPDPNAFQTYKKEEKILAFGLWESRGVKESTNKKAGSPIKTFRNHELRLWPVTKSQLCAVKS
ncbi:MAG TPA: hypothetical protein VFX23_13970 [Limnobacter sp.]|uniref:hypothetical protein n=1 Tax=Limnobacter sp. TaxID=2003368 RepID=UPI002E3114A7|nr:hypothetical protein [Limnobacter sp.]HEX5487091.1 hypothetical protein [Limnobacter sp.]